MLDQVAANIGPSFHLGHQKLSELGALRSIAGAVYRQMRGVEAVLHNLLEEACRLILTDHGSLVLINRKTRKLEIVAVAGADWTVEKRSCLLGLNEGITGRVAATGRPYICPNTENDPYYYPLFETVRSELAVPFLSEGQVVGLLNLDSPLPNAFTSDDAALLAAQFRHVPYVI